MSRRVPHSIAANLDLARFWVVILVPSGTDHVARRAFYDSECSTGGEMVVEVGTEDFLTPAVALRVLFPERRIRGDRIQVGEVVDAQRPPHDQLSFESRLAVHPSSPSSSHSRQAQSPSTLSSALSAAGTIVTPQRGQIGGRSSMGAYQYRQPTVREHRNVSGGFVTPFDYGPGRVVWRFTLGGKVLDRLTFRVCVGDTSGRCAAAQRQQ